MCKQWWLQTICSSCCVCLITLWCMWCLPGSSAISPRCMWCLLCHEKGSEQSTHMAACIIIFIAPCNTHLGQCLPVPATACLCHLYVMCSPGTSLLAWHVEPVVMKLMSVQVCSGSTDHAEPAQMTCDPQQAEHGKLVDLLCVPDITPEPPTELALMSTNKTHPAEQYHTEEQQV